MKIESLEKMASCLFDVGLLLMLSLSLVSITLKLLFSYGYMIYFFSTMGFTFPGWIHQFLILSLMCLVFVLYICLYVMITEFGYKFKRYYRDRKKARLEKIKIGGEKKDG